MRKNIARLLLAALLFSLSAARQYPLWRKPYMATDGRRFAAGTASSAIEGWLTGVFIKAWSE